MARLKFQHIIDGFEATAVRVNENIPTSNHVPHSMRGSLNQLGTVVRSLATLHDTRSPTDNESKHYQRVSKAADNVKVVRARVFKELNGELSEAMNEIKYSIGQKVKLVEKKYAMELRGAVLKMTSAERLAFLRQASIDNDGATLAALLDSPPVLSGLTKELQEVYRTDVIQRHCPNEVAAQAQIVESFETAMRCCKVADDFCAGLADAEKNADIERGEKAIADVEAQIARAAAVTQS